MAMLTPYRVLDLTTERGLLCGQMLGDLGADVVKIEPPGGSAARAIGPFYNDAPHPDRSLYWWAYNRNKRAITLDIERDAGRELLLRLVERADFFIESDNPGHMARHHLGFDDLALVLFYFGRGGFENFHIDNVVSTIDAVRLVTTDEHPNFLRDALSRHIANTRPTQIVKLQPNVLCFFLRFARCAFTSFGYVRAAVSTFKST